MANRIALDSGALIKLGDGDKLTRAILRKWTEEGWETIVPAPVLAETLRGKTTDAPINRILNAHAGDLRIVGIDERSARDAGTRLGRSGMRPEHTIDALIVACAVAERAEHLLTGDRRDITSLAAGDLKVLAI
jgi:predicted nucleic acid-binding protein